MHRCDETLNNFMTISLKHKETQKTREVGVNNSRTFLKKSNMSTLVNKPIVLPLKLTRRNLASRWFGVNLETLKKQEDSGSQTKRYFLENLQYRSDKNTDLKWVQESVSPVKRRFLETRFPLTNEKFKKPKNRTLGNTLRKTRNKDMSFDTFDHKNKKRLNFDLN